MTEIGPISTAVSRCLERHLLEQLLLEESWVSRQQCLKVRAGKHSTLSHRQTLQEAVSGLAVPSGGNEEALSKEAFVSQSGQGWVFSTTSSISPVAADAVVKKDFI